MSAGYGHCEDPVHVWQSLLAAGTHAYRGLAMLPNCSHCSLDEHPAWHVWMQVAVVCPGNAWQRADSHSLSVVQTCPNASSA
jgi:hypothetical protein